MPAALRPLVAAVVLVAGTAGGLVLAQRAPIVAQDLLVEEQPVAGGTAITVTPLQARADGTADRGASRRYTEARF